jgi:hypothetical protein
MSNNKPRFQLLPTETLIEIIQYLPLESQSYVSRTCKVLRQIAEMLMYHKIDYLGPVHEKEGDTYETRGDLNNQYTNFFRTCCQCNNFSKLRWIRVLEFSAGLILDQNGFIPEAFDHGSASRVLLDNFFQASKFMDHVKELHITFGMLISRVVHQITISDKVALNISISSDPFCDLLGL